MILNSSCVCDVGARIGSRRREVGGVALVRVRQGVGCPVEQKLAT